MLSWVPVKMLRLKGKALRQAKEGREEGRRLFLLLKLKDRFLVVRLFFPLL